MQTSLGNRTCITMAFSVLRGRFLAECGRRLGGTAPTICRHGSSASHRLGIEDEPNPAKLFTEQHAAMQATLNKIVENDINPYVDEWEAAGDFPAHKIFKILGDAGLLGVTKPVEYGGLGLDYSYGVAIAMALGNINCGAVPMAIGVQTDMATPALAKFGSDALRREFLAPAIAGDVVTSIAVSETGGGSDVANIKTTAVKKGDDFVINGSKMWITNAWQSDWLCTLVNTGDGPMHKNKSLIIIPTNTKGVTKTQRIDKMGMRSSDTAEIVFEDVRVPQSYVIGQEGMGFMYQMMQFQEERLYAAASVLNSMQKCIDQTMEYTKDRKVFGQPLLHMQTVHFTLAELQTELECLRSLVFRATGQYIEGQDVTQLASMCKLKAGRLARQIADSCLQYWGGMGFTNQVLISRFYRDFRLLSIGGGADEVMLGIICKYMGSLPKRGF